MTTLVMVRHGQSMANIEGIFAGNTDIPLSPLGFEQAKRTAKYISENFKIDKVYASDLSRAFETGRVIAENTDVEIIPEKNLREIFAGSWEGMKFEELSVRYSDDYRLWMEDIGVSQCTGGESVEQLKERVMKALTKISEENDGKTVAIATHATPIRIAETLIKTGTLTEMKNTPWVSNASVTVVEYENGKFTLNTVGYDEHLSDCKTNLPANV